VASTAGDTHGGRTGSLTGLHGAQPHPRSGCWPVRVRSGNGPRASGARTASLLWISRRVPTRHPGRELGPLTQGLPLRVPPLESAGAPLQGPRPPRRSMRLKEKVPSLLWTSRRRVPSRQPGRGLDPLTQELPLRAPRLESAGAPLLEPRPPRRSMKMVLSLSLWSRRVLSSHPRRGLEQRAQVLPLREPRQVFAGVPPQVPRHQSR